MMSKDKKLRIWSFFSSPCWSSHQDELRDFRLQLAEGFEVARRYLAIWFVIPNSCHDYAIVMIRPLQEFEHVHRL